MFSLAVGGTSSPSDCFRAQTIPQLFGNEGLNPDVGGVAVAVSNIVINVCLSVLLRWSDDDSQTTILMLFSQVYPVMLATAISINTDNLSLFDAHFAVAVTASPASIYLAYSSVISVFGYPNKLFKVPGSLPSKMSWAKQMIRALGIALPFIWLVVNIICCFFPHAFRNSPENCQSMTIVSWFEFQAVSNFVGILDVMGRRDLWSDLTGRGGLGLLSLITMWIWAIYLVRHRYDIYEHIQSRREHQRANGKHRNLLVRWFLVVFNVPLSSWFVITKSHPWMLFAIVIFLHWSWILGIAKGMSIKNYQFTYGQITSAFATVPPILSVAKLAYFRKTALWHFLQKFLGNFIQGMRYIVTGSPNARKPESNLISNFNLTPRHSHVEMQTLPTASLSAAKSSDLTSDQAKDSSSRTSSHVLDRHLWIVCILCVVANLADIVWIYYYVEAGTKPNPRTQINGTPGAWKTYSVSLYVYGYFVCFVNILLWTTWYGKQFPSPSTGFYQSVLRITRSVCLALAFVMCIAPLFSPFAALPLAQQWQWSHSCKAFSGEVILRGITNPLQMPSLSFYYPSYTRNGIELSFHSEYRLFSNNSDNTPSQELVFSLSSNLSSTKPSIRYVSYTTKAKIFSAYCTSEEGKYNELCATGNYASPYFAFTINDLQRNMEIRLRAQNKDWSSSSDAPSVILKYQNITDDRMGSVAIESAITQRNHCENLKVCLSSSTPDLATLIPLGILLIAQNSYAQYCLQPSIYSI